MILDGPFARTRRTLALASLVVVAGACGGGEGSTPVAGTAGRDGLSLRAELSATEHSLVVQTLVRNDRSRPVSLKTDWCGNVTAVVLERTMFAPAGRTWSGSLQAVKRSVVAQQGWRQHPNRFAPRIPGDPSATVPRCHSPSGPRRLAPGQEVAERWELDFDKASGLQVVGSAATVVRVDIMESRTPDEQGLLDGWPKRVIDQLYAARNVRVQHAVSSVLAMSPSRPLLGLSPGLVFDRLVRNGALREWIEAQPPRSWRSVQLRSGFETTSPDYPVKLTLVTNRYERAAIATADADGSNVSVSLPTEADIARSYSRRRGTLPPGTAVIHEPKGFDLRQDVLAGSLRLPSGRVTVDEFFYADRPLPLRVPRGSYPVFVTLAKGRSRDDVRVALATLVFSGRPTVRWRRVGGVGVDGGNAAFTSVEGAAFFHALGDKDPPEFERLFERIWNAQAANDHIVTNYPLEPGLDVVVFSTGLGDGGYPIYVGYDAAGRPTRMVVDCGLLHLDWPS